MSQVRLLTSADVPRATELSTDAGWNQTPCDWQMLLELAPEGCFGIDCDGVLVATATLISYGSTLGWIGMVLTEARHRRRGLARALLIHGLERADALGIETLKLDATEQGQPLYEKLGFRVEQAVERWYRSAGDRCCGGEPPAWAAELDALAYVADRGRMLQALTRRGCASGRPGSRAPYTGPLLAENPSSARRLLDAGPCYGYWDLLPANREAVAIAEESGFEPQRHLLRMMRGRELRGREELIYAIAGFELG